VLTGLLVSEPSLNFDYPRNRSANHSILPPTFIGLCTIGQTFGSEDTNNSTQNALNISVPVHGEASPMRGFGLILHRT
jgi:hypothetical protein